MIEKGIVVKQDSVQPTDTELDILFPNPYTGFEAAIDPDANGNNVSKVLRIGNNWHRMTYQNFMPFFNFPALRGLWTMAADNGSGNVVDFINGLTLTNVKGLFSANNGFSYLDLTDSTSYLTRTDEATLDILASESYVAEPGITWGGWFRHNGAWASPTALMGKWVEPGNNRSFNLRVGSGSLRLELSGNGSGISVFSPVATPSADTWYWIVARYAPNLPTGQVTSIWLDDIAYQSGVTGGGAIYNSTAPLDIGRYQGAGSTYYFDGDVAMCFLAASAVPESMILQAYYATKHIKSYS